MKNIKKVKERIEKLSYPYLRNLPDDSNLSKKYLTLINEIAKQVYIKPNEINGTMSFSHLFDCYNASKKSWKLYEKNNDVKAYIHVQAITLAAGEAIKNSSLDENDISINDIISDEKQNEQGFIHIGSIASKEYPLPYKEDLPYILIAGVIDRILELRENNPYLKFIIATAFEDSTGDNHFLGILPKYGFEYIGKSKSKDEIYQIDLEATDRPFSELIKVVSKKRIEYYKRKKKVKTLIEKIPSFNHIKSFVDYVIKTYKSIKET
ncbi:hypothetical protein NNO_1033 [Hydrogenimonas sp.]|nr:hypothetical protein NNO_1033 [Hydrogenimonas sp.]